MYKLNKIIAYIDLKNYQERFSTPLLKEGGKELGNRRRKNLGKVHTDGRNKNGVDDGTSCQGQWAISSQK